MENDNVNEPLSIHEQQVIKEDVVKDSYVNNEEETGLHEILDDTELKKEELRSKYWLYFVKLWPAFAVLYWKAYGIIGMELFERFNVYYVSHYTRYKTDGSKKFSIYSKEENPVFAFKMPAKPNSFSKESFYIYRPYDQGGYKHGWVGNTPYNHIWGLDQLPDEPDHIIIAAGRKDTLVWTNLGFNAVTLNSENSKLYPPMFTKILSKAGGRKEKIVVAYDNDDTGNKRSGDLSKEFKIGNLNEKGFIPNGLVFPDGKKVKDISDVVKYYLLNKDREGLEKYRQYLGRLIHNIITPPSNVFSELFEGNKTVLKQKQLPQQEVPNKQEIPAITPKQNSVESFPAFDEIAKDIPLIPVTEELSGSECHFIRDGITITGEGKRATKRRNIRAIVVIDDSKLAKLLGDAENPAHTEWQKNSSHFEGKYTNGDKVISFIRSCIDNLTRWLNKPEEGIDMDVLQDIFFIETVGDMAETFKPKPLPGKNPNEPQVPIIEPKPQPISIQQERGGLKVTYNQTYEREFSGGVILDLAYMVSKGNPLRKYSQYDFDIGKSPIEIDASGISDLVYRHNRLSFVVENSIAFNLVIKGFDIERDLYIKAKVNYHDKEV